MPTVKEAAEIYRSRGWQPIAVQPNGKIPKGLNWEGELREGDNIGIRTGKVSGIVVLDFDGEMGRITRETLNLPPTLEARTRSGGTHLVFAAPPEDLKTCGRAMPGMDVRAEGGQIVVEPSTMDGGAWTWVNDLSPAPLPDWMLGLLLAQAPREGEVPTPLEEDDPRRDMAIARARDYLAGAPLSIEGQAGGGTFLIVCEVLTRRYMLSDEDAIACLEAVYWPRLDAAGERRWEGAELLHKLDSARRTGAAIPVGFDTGLIAALSAAIVLRSPKPERRRPNPGHTYTWAPGDFQSSGGRGKAKLAPDEVANILLADAAWEGVLQFDAFRRRIRAVNPPFSMEAERGALTEADVFNTILWFASVHGVTVSKENAYGCLVSIAMRQSYHPVHEWLDGLPSEAPGAIEALCDCMGLAQGVERIALRRFLISAVARVRVPGCKVDDTLVLVGEQGTRKSSWVRAMFGDEFTCEGVGDISKPAQILCGKWGVEIPEMANFLQHDPAKSKDYLTRRVDTYRAPYARSDDDYPRTCVFVGTANPGPLFRDPTGERRYKVVQIRAALDIDRIEALRGAAWAEAQAAWRSGEVYHWTAEEEVSMAEAQEEYKETQIDPWLDVVRDVASGREYVTSREVLDALEKPLAQRTKTDDLRLASLYRALGFVSSRTGKGRRWKVSDAVRGLAPSAKETRRRAMATVASAAN